MLTWAFFGAGKGKGIIVVGICVGITGSAYSFGATIY